jgi:hypothetical protein
MRPAFQGRTYFMYGKLPYNNAGICTALKRGGEAMISRRFQYFFRRDEAGDLDPKMYMRKPADGGAEVKATVVRVVGGTGMSGRRGRHHSG